MSQHDETRLVGMGMHYEDLPVGTRVRTVGRTITDADITNFVSVTGMLEVLFTNIEYTRTQSVIGGRPAPGAMVFSFAEGLIITGTIQMTGMAFLGMTLEIHRPVVAGDTIHVVAEVTEARPTSKPGRGILTTRNEVYNQRGEKVMTYTPTRMIKRRPG